MLLTAPDRSSQIIRTAQVHDRIQMSPGSNRSDPLNPYLDYTT
jgi:hypothetical protein